MDKRRSFSGQLLRGGTASLYILTFLFPLFFHSMTLLYYNSVFYFFWLSWFVSVYLISGYVSGHLVFAARPQSQLPYPISLVYRLGRWLLTFTIMLYPGLWLWNFLFPL